MPQYYVYILCSEKNGTLYIGVTCDLARRVYEHKTKGITGFTAKYSVDRLVYAEEYESVYDALKREKLLKQWNRKWKIDLIEKVNPDWDDLYNHGL